MLVLVRPILHVQDVPFDPVTMFDGRVTCNARRARHSAYCDGSPNLCYGSLTAVAAGF
jgi:hypothetical protein